MSFTFTGGVQPVLKETSPTKLGLLIAAVLFHGAALYCITHARGRNTHDGPALFGPATSNDPRFVTLRPVTSRLYQSPISAMSNPVQTWHFPRVDLWPVTGEGQPAPSEFGPLMDAE